MQLMDFCEYKFVFASTWFFLFTAFFWTKNYTFSPALQCFQKIRRKNNSVCFETRRPWRDWSRIADTNPAYFMVFMCDFHRKLWSCHHIHLRRRFYHDLSLREDKSGPYSGSIVLYAFWMVLSYYGQNAGYRG